MNGNQTLMDVFKDPELIHNLSFGEKMLGSTITMIMGLGITFLILILIWIFISIMGKVLEAVSKPKNETKAEPVQAAAASADDEVSRQASDGSLAAVISAAIAAYEGDSADNRVVRRITRLSGDSTPWARAANEARMATRKM